MLKAKVVISIADIPGRLVQALHALLTLDAGAELESKLSNLKIQNAELSIVGRRQSIHDQVRSRAGRQEIHPD